MKDADVRKFVSVTGVVLVLLGMAWRFAGWIVEWTSRLLGPGGVTSSYEAFVQDYARVLMTEGSFAKIFGPWLMMGVGLILLAVLHLPRRKGSEVR